ncbi:tigger transposable element-derived protein 4 [Trichonephila clavipes]|nr:tigger transposable element-derived protein 4 [Trichonephila clavipes]
MEIVTENWVARIETLRSTVISCLVDATIIKNRDKLQNYDSSNSCSKHLRTCVYEDVDVAVLKWKHTMRDKNVPISGPFVIEKDLRFANALRYDQFLGRNGWLEKLKKRHKKYA